MTTKTMMMRAVTVIITVLAGAMWCFAAATYAETRKKADRFFDNHEWASATALYNFMLKERPTVADTYGRAIVATAAMADTVQSMDLLDQAMSYNVPLDSVLTKVQHYSFKIGEGRLYEEFMLRTAAHYHWLSRPIDAYLLRYYTFRRNGPQMVTYARRMLSGVPNNTSFLATLAEGYMIDGKPDKAVETWLKIIDIAPDDWDALLNLANYYDITGRPDLALPYFRRAADIRPTPYVESKINQISGAH